MERLKSVLGVPRLGGVLLLACASLLLAAPAPAAPPTRTRAEVDKLIGEAGKTQPDWWEATPLNFPATLKLDWTTVKGWNNQVNLGAYFWDIIDPNPGKWKEGVKLAMHTYTLNKGNADAQVKSIHQLAHIYGEMLQDYPRAAFWAKKAGDQQILDPARRLLWERADDKTTSGIMARRAAALALGLTGSETDRKSVV